MSKPDDIVHWEDIVRTMLERLGAEAFAELIDYVLEDEPIDMTEAPEPIG